MGLLVHFYIAFQSREINLGIKGKVGSKKYPSRKTLNINTLT